MADYQGFYSVAQVSRLAGVPSSTLYQWKNRGILRPSLQMKDGDKVVAEGYSYADLTLVRVLKALRERRLNFDSAANALRHLYQRLGPPNKGWADEHVYVVDGHVYADRDDEWNVTDATGLGQKVETRVFGDLFEELRDLEAGASLIVPVQFRKFIHVDPNVMGGEPVIRGTRLATATVTTMLKRYKTLDRLAEMYTSIPREKLERAIEFEHYLDERVA